MSLEQLKIDISRDFGTPAVVIDLDVVERNIAKLQKMCDDAGVANRPHIKTHKIPALAHKQLEVGAQGITCQKLGEAEIMVDAGIEDIVVSYNLIGAARSGRLAKLIARKPVKVCADNPVTLYAYAEAGRAAARVVGVLIECDTGRKRAGVETVSEALQLAEIIKGDPNLAFEGLLAPAVDGA